MTIISDDDVLSLITHYFHTLYSGENLLDAPPLKLNLHVVKKPPSIPADSVKSIKGPNITSYRNYDKIYFVLEDGSHICLDPKVQRAEGFLRSQILDNSLEVCSLIGSSIFEMLKYSGLYLLHAAALKGNGINCLVSGDGGCGKTTTTLSLVREGFKYVSDDSLFLREEHDGICVSPLYTHVHLDQDLADRFPEISEGKNLEITEWQKAPVDISSVFPNAYITSLRPDVLIFPRVVSNRESLLKPISQVEVYTRLLKQTILAVDNDISRNHLSILKILVKQTKGFELISGRDMYEDPGILIKLMIQNIGET